MPSDRHDDPPAGGLRRQALLHLRTVRHLRAAQPVHRVRLRTQRALVASSPARARRLLAMPLPDQPGWPRGWRCLDERQPAGYPSAAANAEGRFEFLSEARHVGDDWQQATASRLWRFHLHYFEWAWSFAAHPDRPWARAAFGQRWRSWRSATTFGVGDAWSPYVAAMRAWALCGVFGRLIAGTADEAELAAELAAHAGFLRWHVEHDVGGNHVVKNLKALFGLGVFLGNDRLLDYAARQLRRELGRQVLADGGHFERSPSYHCQVLGDLMDVAALAGAAGCARVRGLCNAIGAMRGWLGAMLMPDGEVPSFNDSVPVGAGRIRLLEPSRPGGDRLQHLHPSGYLILRPDERTHLVLDVGPPCPPELPAHAHADCLSFELAIDGTRVLVNSGTSTYEPGPRRAYERSTRAHNSVEVDGADQTELWGVFRAARRARPRLHRLADDGRVLEVVASHDGYRRLTGRPTHRRSWRCSAGTVELVDEVWALDTDTHAIRAFLHAAPGLAVTMRDGRSATIGPLRLTVVSGQESLLRPLSPGEDLLGWVAAGFGRLRPASGLELATDCREPARITTRLTY